MPTYQQILVALPKCDKTELCNIVRRYANVVLENGGVLRGVDNHGLRMLPERSKRYVPPSIIFIVHQLIYFD
jgi:ribosomal protein S6